MNRGVSILLLVSVLWAVSVSAASGQQPSLKRSVSEKRLASVDTLDLSKREVRNPGYWVSPDGRRFAYAAEKGFVVDGQAFNYEYGVKPESFSFSPDSRRTAYAAKTSRGQNNGRIETLVVDGQESTNLYSNVDTPVFSPDSKHVACIVRISPSTGEHAVWIDGREVGKADTSFNWEVAFTADSQRVVYAVQTGERYIMREDSVDAGQPQTLRTHGPAVLTGNFFYGPAGQLGYIAKDAAGKFFVFYDGREETVRLEELDVDDVTVSDDGRHLAYVGEPESFADMAVFDGRPGKVYRAFDGDIVRGSLAISPDGRRWGYAVEDGRESHVVIDGRPGQFFENVAGPVFSPDSQHVAYLATANGKVFSVVDGKPGAGFDDRGAPVFGPDSKAAAYWAELGGKQFVVHNGQRQKAYDSVGSPYFSPDGKRLVYLAQSGDKVSLVDTGREGRAYDDIKARLYFSDDSSRLAMVAIDGDKQMVVVNGVEGSRYDTVLTIGGAKVHFDSADRFHYLAAKGGELFLIEEVIE